MKMKKWLSMLLAAILILNIVLPTNVFAETEAQELNEVTVYVSASGSDDTGDGTSSNPYATISKAEAELEANTNADIGRIIISGSVTFSASAHTKMITIAGDASAGTKLVVDGCKAILGPTTIEDIALDLTTTNQSFETRGSQLIFGDNVTDPGTGTRYVVVGSQYGSETGKAKFTVDSWGGNNYTQLQIKTSAASMAGAEVVVNNATKITLIHLNCSGVISTKFTDDVNITVNGGTVDAIGLTGTPTFEKALQIILNNGVSTEINDAVKNYNVTGGKWLMYGATGGNLSTTDIAGYFKVTSDTGLVAKATNRTTGDIYYAASGNWLHVPAGEYDVAYVNATEDISASGMAVRFVSATGNDTNDGLTQETAFATTSAAETSLETIFQASTAAEGLIVINGSVNFTASTHTKMITIIGDGESGTQLNISTDNTKKNILGPTTLENITLNSATAQNAGNIQTVQSKLVFGENVVVTGTQNAYYRVGADSVAAGNNTATGGKPTLIINSMSHNTSGKYNFIRVGTGSGHWMNGAEITINGGTVSEINFHRATQFSDDVNLTVNGGSVEKIYKQTHDSFTGTYKFHKALQIIFNNGSKDNVTTFDKDSLDSIDDVSGKWYIYGDTTGGSLSTTETAGTFKVNGSMYAQATSTTDSSAVYYGVPGGTITVPEGEYNVTYLSVKPEGYVELTLDGVSQGLFASGAQYELPTPEKEEYTFTGWTDGTTTYNGGETVTLSTSLDLTSTWYKETAIVYVSSTGSDSNTGEETSPFATIAYALAELDKVNASTRRIVMLNDMTYTSATHTNMVEIVGNTDSVTLTIQNKTAVGGPTTFKNFKTGTTFSPVSNGHKVIYENIKGGGTGIGKIYIGTINTSGGQEDKVTFTSFGTTGASMLRVCGVEGATSDVNLVLNSGKFHQVMFEGTNTFDGDVNITVNGGTFGTTIGNNYSASTTFNGNFQLVMNDGTGNINVDEGLRSIVSNGRSWFMYDDVNEATSSVRTDRKQYAGCSLKITDTAGTFNVLNGSALTTVYAVATNLANPSIVYYSDAATADKDGVLTVPAGEWVVTYETQKPDWYCTGSQIVFNNTVENFDLASVTSTEYEDRIIVGWMNGEELATDGTFEAGTRLQAVYAGYTKKANFYIEDTEIRLDDGGLRFKINMDLNLYNELNGYAESVAEYGIIAIKADNVPYQNCGDIVIGGTYNEKTPAVIASQNVFEMYNNELTYTLCLTDIETDAYYTDYMVRGYIKFVDQNGEERVVYTDFEQSSIKATVEKMLADDTVNDSIKETLNSEYMTVINAKRTELATSLALLEGEATLSSDSAYPDNYEFTPDNLSGNPFKVRTIEINRVNAESTAEDLTLVQLTDLHINHLSEKDFADNRQTVLSFYRNREHAKNAAYAKVAERALAYADAVADQVIVTGDTLDNMNEGALDLSKRLIWSRYPNIISTTGNHEWTERSVGKVADVLTKDEMQARLQEDATHDVLYSMKLINDVMIIQMDNASGNDGEGYGYEQSQIDSLTADLATAKSNGYTVLIFQHIPLKEDEPHNPSGANDNDKYFNEIKTPTSSPTTNTTTTGECNAAMIELIKSNSDIIKGIFCGHTHIQSDSTVGGIPQYIVASNQYDGGCALKIIVK